MNRSSPVKCRSGIGTKLRMGDEVTMTVPLTEEQIRAVAARPDEPVRLIDPKTNESFVLLRGEDYERICSLREDDFDIRDT